MRSIETRRIAAYPGRFCARLQNKQAREVGGCVALYVGKYHECTPENLVNEGLRYSYLLWGSRKSI